MLDTTRQYKTRNGKFVGKFLRAKSHLPGQKPKFWKKELFLWQLGSTDPRKFDADGQPILFIREHDGRDAEGPLAFGRRDPDAGFRLGFYTADGAAEQPKDAGLDLVEEVFQS